ncbi:MAG: type II toxin-antitoxin system VapC family toxin [Novosphingobium sp.]|jgi:predicted nucleic acid-binding protein|nr:type II toxin-antitoxin system VapC family toxin [Novosphingobium sp.]
MYLLDTNIVSELRRPRPHGAVLAWLDGVDDRDLHFSAMTLAEIQAGIEITRAQDPAKAVTIEAWLDKVADSYNILSADGAIFRQWARFMHREQDHLIEDALIAATAHVHDLAVVTRNVRDFEKFGVRVVNPFT